MGRTEKRVKVYMVLWEHNCLKSPENHYTVKECLSLRSEKAELASVIFIPSFHAGVNKGSGGSLFKGYV